jgi:hypothetical protein
MKTQSVLAYSMMLLLACVLSACGPRRPKFIAPEIEPPADLIPSYVPEGFQLVDGFQLEGGVTTATQDLSRLVGRVGFDLKSPAGNEIQGVYFQKENQLILITKSYYPGGTLDDWRAAFEEPLPKPLGLEPECDCECRPARLARPDPELFPSRFGEIREERTIGETRVAVLQSGGHWVAVFMRGEYLLTVESGSALEQSGIPLEENLKIAASLLEKQS